MITNESLASDHISVEINYCNNTVVEINMDRTYSFLTYDALSTLISELTNIKNEIDNERKVE